MANKHLKREQAYQAKHFLNRRLFWGVFTLPKAQGAQGLSPSCSLRFGMKLFTHEENGKNMYEQAKRQTLHPAALKHKQTFLVYYTPTYRYDIKKKKF